MSLIFSLLFSWVFAKELIFDAFLPGAVVLHPTQLSELQAKNIFNEFKAMDFIPYQYGINGCHARATAMALHAERKGVKFVKIYAHTTPTSENKLVVRNSIHKPQVPIFWYFHVAVATYVNFGDRIDIMVFDPSLFDRPVDVEEWASLMESEYTEADFRIDGNWDRLEKGLAEYIYFGERFQNLASYTVNDKITKWDAKILKDNKNELLRYLKILQKGVLKPGQEENLNRAFAIPE